MKFITSLFISFLYFSTFAHAETKKILFIAGPQSHSNGEHEFKAGCKLLANALNESGLDVEAIVTTNGWPHDQVIFEGVDACVVYADAAGRFGDKYAVLDEYHKKGMALMFVHYGVHPSKQIGEQYFHDWIGGFFETGWSVNPHWIADMIPKDGHPIARGIKEPVTAFDEFYYNMRFPKDCGSCYPLVEATPTPDRMVKYINLWNEHGDACFNKKQALMWCNDPENGARGVGFTGGHYHRNWAIDAYRKLVLNSIVWLAGLDVPADGVPSKSITKEMLQENLDKPNPDKPIELPTEALLQQTPMERPDLSNGYQPRNNKKQWVPPVKAEPVPLSLFEAAGEDLEVSLWAASPLLYNPTNMDIDHKGRIWVAEGVNYRRSKPRPEGDRIVILQDTNGDGTADSSQTFVQDKDLKAPLGVAVFDNVVIVPSPPNLIKYTDVDRDLKFNPSVDKKEILLTGFNAFDHDHSLHSLTAGPDGKWYFNNGNCGAVFKDKSGKNFYMNGVYKGGGGRFDVDNNLGGKASDDGYVWTSGFTVRMDEDGSNVEIVGHGYRNSYEQSINSMGDIFQNDNDDYSGCRNSYVLEYGSAGFFNRFGTSMWRAYRRDGEPVQSAHWRQLDPGTFDAGDVYGIGSPTGNTFYENGALGDRWEGTYLACEPGQNSVFGYHPESKGAGFNLDRFDFVSSNADKEFIGGDSTKRIQGHEQKDNLKIMFRPSDVCVGPDGAVYVTDWYDGRVGGHSTLDTSTSGFIYRIAPKGFNPQIPDYDLSTVEGQIEVLKSPAKNTRYLGFKALKAQGDAVTDQVAALLQDNNKWIRSRAIYLLAQLGPKGLAKCESLLSDPNEEHRLVAYRALRRANKSHINHAQRLAKDPSLAVRRDVALSLRHFSAEESKGVFAELAGQLPAGDKNYLESIGLGAENKENEIWTHLKNAFGQTDPNTWTPDFAKLTWRLWPSAAVNDLKQRALNTALSIDDRKFAVESISFIQDPSAAMALADICKIEDLKSYAVKLAILRSEIEWSKYNFAQTLKDQDIHNPDKIQVQNITVPKAAAKKYSVADVMKLTGDVEKGKLGIMRCVMCHNVNGTGPDYGPQLKGWGKTQSKEAIVKSIVDPSADIAHGYTGYAVKLKYGKGQVHGLLQSNADPVVVLSTGGVQQKIPKPIVANVRNLKRSLMLSADQLGLSAQDVADIVAFMQQWE